MINVLYAKIPDILPPEPLVPRSRQCEVDRAASDTVKREKYFVWRLLEQAVKETFNLDFDNIEFTKTVEGKWLCDKFYFSLSHSHGVAVVAVSDSPVGVDIELVRDIRQGTAEKMLTERELHSIEGLADIERAAAIIELWSRKESRFKMQGGEALLPSLTEADENARCRRLSIDGRAYILAVTAESVYDISLRKITFYA